MYILHLALKTIILFHTGLPK